MIEFISKTNRPTATSLMGRIVFKKRSVHWDAVSAGVRVTEILGPSKVRGPVVILNFDPDTNSYIDGNDYDRVDRPTIRVADVYAVCDSVAEAIKLRMQDHRAGAEFVALKKRAAEALAALAGVERSDARSL
jgi:hypothetical protein